jgi:hypothetical protein
MRLIGAIPIDAEWHIRYRRMTTDVLNACA